MIAVAAGCGIVPPQTTAPGTTGRHGHDRDLFTAAIRPVPAVPVLDWTAPASPRAGWTSVLVRVIARGRVPAVDVGAVRLTIEPVAARPVRVLVAASDVTPAFDRAWRVPAGRHPSRTLATDVGADGNVRVWVTGRVRVSAWLTGWQPDPPLAVRAPNLPHDPHSPFTAADVATARQVLLNTNRYALTTWRHTVLPLRVTALQHNQIEPSESIAAEAYALALSLRSGTYDVRATGVDPATATAFTRQLIDLVAFHHAANRPGGWGQPWLRDGCRTCEHQEGLCAALAARAGWLLWAELSGGEQRAVVRMLEYEADRELQIPVHYLRDRRGRILTPGNTGADELVWEANAPALAAAMLPTGTHRSAWLFKTTQLNLAAWSRPRDVTAATVVGGAPLSRWLDGSNVEPNGELVNHNRIAPDYVGEIDQSISVALDLTLAGQSAPTALRHNLDVVYATLTHVNHPSPPYLPPGGTVYRPRSSTVYWPVRSDWGSRQPIGFALIDAEAAAFGFGGPDALGYARLHARDALQMQARSPDGRSYLSPAEFSKATGEEQTARLAANLYLTETLGGTATAWRDLSVWSPPFDREYRGRDTTAPASRWIR